MRIRVLGCSGSIAAGSRTTSFLVDQHLLVDAGTGVGDLSLDEMAAVDHIVLSHSHLDHVLAIGLLADSVTRRRRGRPPVRVHALRETLDALRQHVFNGVIWPDFTRLPTAEQPVLAFEPFDVGQVLTLGGRQVEVLPASHTVPACGFAVYADDGGAWVYTGDTGPCPVLRQRLTALDLRALVIETAFGNDEQTLARISGHLCPATLADELAPLPETAEVWITHIKPGEVRAVMAEVAPLAGGRRLRALQTGQVIAVGNGG
ncbi:MAG: 3',5'-cyclic-nucleotide phosphodiesterase [Burkholderiaceae bacterium]|nr:3',5'-cyclic-nucleotide phosphodiesterase [Burkholderiaceae bacterium]